MNESKEPELIIDLREVRKRYDALSRGAIAQLRRSQTESEMIQIQPYWHVGGRLANQHRDLWLVVSLFARVKHRTLERFSFGEYARRNLGDSPTGQMRFRRLLAARDPVELHHRLRSLLTLACRGGEPVDWGNLGYELLQYSNENQWVQRKWSQGFYAPILPSLDSQQST